MSVLLWLTKECVCVCMMCACTCISHTVMSTSTANHRPTGKVSRQLSVCHKEYPSSRQFGWFSTFQPGVDDEKTSANHLSMDLRRVFKKCCKRKLLAWGMCSLVFVKVMCHVSPHQVASEWFKTSGSNLVALL